MIKASFRPIPRGHSPVCLGNRTTASVTGSGNVTLNIVVNGRRLECKLENVLHVPQLGYQLISVPTLEKSGRTVLLESGKAFVMSKNVLLATGTLQGNLYTLDSRIYEPINAFISVEMDVWHRRLAHLSPTTIAEMSTKNAVYGLNLSSEKSTLNTCKGCIMGKAHRSHIPNSSSKK